MLVLIYSIVCFHNAIGCHDVNKVPYILSVYIYTFFFYRSQCPKERTTLCGLDIEKVLLVVVRDKPKEKHVHTIYIPTDRYSYLKWKEIVIHTIEVKFCNYWAKPLVNAAMEEWIRPTHSSLRNQA